jgi:hypothetical protein
VSNADDCLLYGGRQLLHIMQSLLQGNHTTQ